MQKLAAWALFSGPLEVEEQGLRLGQIRSLIDQWIARKGTLALGTLGQGELALNDGRVASYEATESSCATGNVFDCIVLEPSGKASVRTQLSVGRIGNQVIVYAELQAEGGAYQIGPTRLDIRCPQIVKTLIDSADDWQCGESIVRTQPFSFRGEKDAVILETALWHPDRNLPVVALSQFENELLTPTFAHDLAADLAGVALVAILDPLCSWHLTKTRGKEWSSYNGAVRLFWPGLHDGDTPARHPLWLRDRLYASAATAIEAAAKFRGQLRRQMFKVSALSIPEPTKFAEVRTVHSRRELEAVKSALRDKNDWEGLAAVYAKQNDSLLVAAAADRARIQSLEEELRNLQIALRWSSHEAETEITPESTVPPTSIAEAVQAAKSRFPDDLLFGSDVQEGVEGLAADAGPPDKVLLYLFALAELSAARRENELGIPMIKWLNDRNISCSGESQTTSKSKTERNRRTWDAGGFNHTFDMHLKPSEAVSPDRCVRIYFDYDQSKGLIVVGWVGRHL